MPREIITLQFGQCGNQSNDLYKMNIIIDPILKCIFLKIKLVWNFGNSCVWNME